MFFSIYNVARDVRDVVVVRASCAPAELMLINSIGTNLLFLLEGNLPTAVAH